MRAWVAWGAVLLLFSGLSCRAEGFDFEAASPSFRVTIPGIPQMAMALHPQNATHPHLRFQGFAAPYAVSVFTPAAAAGMTPLECAGATVRALATRPGVPPPQEVYKAKLSDKTFVAAYATQLAVGVQLHAHLLSAAGGTHCIEVHASMASVDDDDLPAWIEILDKARIEPR